MLFRAATMDDAADLLAWRNDPVTRANFKSTAVVTPEEHANWMKLNVQFGGSQHIVMIAHTGIKLGVVRFDADADDVMTYHVSITVAPQWRGKGLGGKILADALSTMGMREYDLVADIRGGNNASTAIFERHNFEFEGCDDEFYRYRRKHQ